MPRLNTHGVALQGLGLVWLDDGAIIGQREQPGGSWAVSTAPSIDGPWTVVANRGCNFIAAGGGNWAAYGGGIFGPGAVAGAAIPAGLDGRGAGSPDGTIALAGNPQGEGLILRNIDGTSFELPDAYPTADICVWDRVSALWMDAKAGLRVCGNVPMFQVLPGPVGWPSVFIALGTWWIAYHSTDATGYVCHPYDSFEGYAITKPPAFYPNAIALDASTARLAWSVDPSETPAGLRVVNQDLNAPRVNLAPSEPIPPIDPHPPIIVDPIPPTEPPVEPPVEPPQPPQEEDTMIAYAPPVPGFLPGELQDNGDGTVSVKKTNGQWLQVSPDGLLGEATSVGIWESFRKGKASLIAERDGGSRGPLVYVLPLAE